MVTAIPKDGCGVGSHKNGSINGFDDRECCSGIAVREDGATSVFRVGSIVRSQVGICAIICRAKVDQVSVDSGGSA